MTKTIKEVRVGTRRIAGTDWPVYDKLQREQLGRKVFWNVVRGLCNGVPESVQPYLTRRDALAAFGAEVPS